MRSSVNACDAGDTKVKRFFHLFSCVMLSLAVAAVAGCSASSLRPPADDHAADETELSHDHDYETHTLYAQRDEHQIYGVIYVPQGASSPMPAVIFSHGFGGTHAVGAQYAQALARAGYVVYCFDFCGGSPDSRSDGSTLEMSLFTEREDLEAVITMMQGLDFVDSDNLFLIGSSQGGAVSAITAAAHPEAIRGMVLLYPAFVLVQRANDMYQHAEQIPDRQFFMWMDVGRVYFEDLLGYDIYAEIPAYKNDVMLIHGDADTIVPLSGSQRAG